MQYSSLMNKMKNKIKIGIQQKGRMERSSMVLTSSTIITKDFEETVEQRSKDKIDIM